MSAPLPRHHRCFDRCVAEGREDWKLGCDTGHNEQSTDWRADAGDEALSSQLSGIAEAGNATWNSFADGSHEQISRDLCTPSTYCH